MYLIIDFALTKLANKVKKKIWENSLVDSFQELIKNRRTRYSPIGSLGSPNLLGKNKAGKGVIRGSNRYMVRHYSGLPQLTRKPRSGEYAPRTTINYEMMTPDSKKYTDIRKVNDEALSESGYMGFKNTPNSYFEESIPMKDMVGTGKKTKVKSRKLV